MQTIIVLIGHHEGASDNVIHGVFNSVPEAEEYINNDFPGYTNQRDCNCWEKEDSDGYSSFVTEVHELMPSTSSKHKASE